MGFFLFLLFVVWVIMFLIICASFGGMLFDFNRLCYLSKQANKEPISFTRRSLLVVCLGAFLPGVSVLLYPEWSVWGILGTALSGAVGFFFVEQTHVYWKKSVNRRNPFFALQSLMFGIFGGIVVLASFWPLWAETSG